MEPKSERKGNKRVSFLESSLAPVETEGPTILHHFAFSLPPLTQTVPRNKCILPGPAMAQRMTVSRRACAARMLRADPAHHLCCLRREPAPWQPWFTGCLLVCPHEVCSPSGREVSLASVKGMSTSCLGIRQSCWLVPVLPGCEGLPSFHLSTFSYLSRPDPQPKKS